MKFIGLYLVYTDYKKLICICGTKDIASRVVSLYSFLDSDLSAVKESMSIFDDFIIWF